MGVPLLGGTEVVGLISREEFIDMAFALGGWCPGMGCSNVHKQGAGI